MRITIFISLNILMAYSTLMQSPLLSNPNFVQTPGGSSGNSVTNDPSNMDQIMTSYINGKMSGSFQLESVPAVLIPFEFSSSTTNIPSTSPLYPIWQSAGLVFQYTPTINETISIKYDSVDIVHSNESYYAYRSTDNKRIELSDCVWTCDTVANAQYALAVIHFFRSYSLMDFGTGRTGRPPSPMWFYAYGNYAYNKVPCLLEGASINWPKDVDYVGVPNPGTQAAANGTLGTDQSSPSAQQYTWIPMKLEISGIRLIVQHTPNFWLGFNLANYKNGTLLSASRTQSPNVAPVKPSMTASKVPPSVLNQDNPALNFGGAPNFGSNPNQPFLDNLANTNQEIANFSGGLP